MKQENQNKYLPYVQIALACFIWGTYGLFVQGVEQSPQVIVFFRFFFGFLSLLLFMGHTKNLRNLIIPGQGRVLIAAGIINAMSWLLMTASIKLTSVANGFILYYTAPCFVILFAPIFLKEKIKKMSLLALVLCFIGIIFVTGFGEWNLQTLNWQGNLMGLGSGICYALYILLLKRLSPNLLGLVANTYVCGVICAVTFPMALPSFHNITISEILILALAGITIQGIATTIYMFGLRRIPAQQASILSYLEVFFASLLAIIFLKENFTINLLIGSILVICGGMMVVFDSNNVDVEHEQHEKTD